MAVIYLPEDTRLSSIGGSLGTLGGGVVQVVQDKRNAQTLAQILSDPVLTDDQKVQRVQNTMGQPGLNLLRTTLDAKAPLLKAQETSANIDKAHADTGKAVAETKRADAQTAIDINEMPLKMQELKSNAAKNQAETLKAQTDVATAPDLRSKADAEARLATLKADQEGLKTDLLKTFSENAKKGGNPLNAAGLSDDIWNSLSPSIQAAARVDVMQGDIKGATDKIASSVQKDKPVAVNDSTMKVINGASTIGNSAKDVLDSVDAGGDKGGPSASLKAWLVEKGLSQGTPEFDKQLAAQHQLLVNSVQSGGGFGGEWKVRLGNKTIPNVLQGPAFQVIETNMILKDRMTELQREKARFEGTSTNTKPIDDAIAELTPLVAKTESMKGDEYGNLYYQNAMVDPKTLKPLPKLESALDPKQVFTFGKDTITGASLNDAARKSGHTPADILKMYQEHAGTTDGAN